MGSIFGRLRSTFVFGMAAAFNILMYSIAQAVDSTAGEMSSLSIHQSLCAPYSVYILQCLVSACANTPEHSFVRPRLHTPLICRVGQNHIYTVYIRYYWQENRSYTVNIYGSGQLYSCAFRLYHSEQCSPNTQRNAPLFAPSVRRVVR